MQAAELMTANPTTVGVTATAFDVMDTMSTLDVRHVPVVDRGELVGMISDRDLHASFSLLRNDNTHARVALSTPVSELMSADPITVDPDTEASEVASLLVENRVGAIPVVDADGKLAGIISYVDVLNALMEKL